MTVKAIVFDLDGTIIKFNLDYKTLRAELIRYLTSRGFPRSLFSLRESVFEMIKKVEVYMRNNGMPKEKIEEIKRSLFSIIDRYELEAAHGASLISGVIPTLESLKKRSIKLAVFTINGKKSTEHILKHFQLSHFFDAVVPRELTPSVKPDPSHLKTVLSILGVKAEETIVVGDGEIDMACAKMVNAIPVGLVSDRVSPEKLISAGASHLLSSFTDLLPLIDEFTKEV